MALNELNPLNRLEPVYYRVQITGFDVDPIDPEDFDGGLPTTGAASLLIEQANMRWESLLRGVSFTIQPLFTPAFDSPNRTVDIPEDDLAFTLTYDRPEYLDTEDELNPPTRLTGADAVKRFIARALVQDEVRNRNIFDPDNVQGPNNSFVNGPQIIKVTAPKVAATIAAVESGLVVTEIANLDNK